ncbi:MAG: tRNA (adenosine(37)-N6)-threonylcarbamoyltransferase complex dimerization subunit type 1 TsaB [Candidatus Saccharibacteria bacterium]
MILLLDTSTPTCKISFIDGENRFNDEWQSNRTLASDLLSHLDSLLKKQDKKWSDISHMGVFEGPGSFTGIRIGLTVMNTIADAQKIPIVGCRGDNWQDEAIGKLQAGKDEKIVLPFYGSQANITSPIK